MPEHERLSNEEAHEFWSAEQLTAFQKMSNRERLNAVKSGALEHWTETARDAALDMLAPGEPVNVEADMERFTEFERAEHALPPQAEHSAQFDLNLIAAGAGWAAMMIAVAAHAYGIS